MVFRVIFGLFFLIAFGGVFEAREKVDYLKEFGREGLFQVRSLKPLKVEGVVGSQRVSGRGVRLDLHLLSGFSEAVNVHIVARSFSSKLTKVSVMSGVGVSAGAAQSGHEAVRELMQGVQVGDWGTVLVPAGGMWVVDSFVLPARQNLHAILRLKQLKGPAVQLDVVVSKSDKLPSGPAPVGFVSQGVFPRAIVAQNLSFDIGKETISEIVVGAVPKGRPEGAPVGMVVAGVLDVRNSASKAGGLDLLFSRRSGPATGLLLLGDSMLAASDMRDDDMNDPSLLHRFGVPAGGKFRVPYFMMVQEGGVYPVELVLRRR